MSRPFVEESTGRASRAQIVPSREERRIAGVIADSGSSGRPVRSRFLRADDCRNNPGDHWGRRETGEVQIEYYKLARVSKRAILKVRESSTRSSISASLRNRLRNYVFGVLLEKNAQNLSRPLLNLPRRHTLETHPSFYFPLLERP